MNFTGDLQYNSSRLNIHFRETFFARDFQNNLRKYLTWIPSYRGDSQNFLLPGHPVCI